MQRDCRQMPRHHTKSSTWRRRMARRCRTIVHWIRPDAIERRNNNVHSQIQARNFSISVSPMSCRPNPSPLQALAVWACRRFCANKKNKNDFLPLSLHLGLLVGCVLGMSLARDCFKPNFPSERSFCTPWNRQSPGRRRANRERESKSEQQEYSGFTGILPSFIFSLGETTH